MKTFIVLTMYLVADPSVYVEESYWTNDMKHCQSYGQSIELNYETDEIEVYFSCHKET